MPRRSRSECPACPGSYVPPGRRRSGSRAESISAFPQFRSPSWCSPRARADASSARSGLRPDRHHVVMAHHTEVLYVKGSPEAATSRGSSSSARSLAIHASAPSRRTRAANAGLVAAPMAAAAAGAATPSSRARGSAAKTITPRPGGVSAWFPLRTLSGHTPTKAPIRTVGLDHSRGKELETISADHAARRSRQASPDRARARRGA
jgi:hypothetical protein